MFKLLDRLGLEAKALSFFDDDMVKQEVAVYKSLKKAELDNDTAEKIINSHKADFIFDSKTCLIKVFNHTQGFL